jgi:F0F1-type ATP synthase membrane subunit a
MVVVELISLSIRPLTLRVRLSANLTAGHLILGLISGREAAGVGPFVIVSFLQVLVFVLETVVAFIQAYVFSLLVLLYTIE